MAESFFATLKVGLVHDVLCPPAARGAVFDYSEAFYNWQRHHSSLGFLSPLAFERRWESMGRCHAAALGSPAVVRRALVSFPLLPGPADERDGRSRSGPVVRERSAQLAAAEVRRRPREAVVEVRQRDARVHRE